MPPTTPDHSGDVGGSSRGSIGLVGAAAMGVGGMMGAGLYTLLGLAATSAGVLLPLSFAVAGIAASFSVYSYAALGSTYPSRGGAAHFLIMEFGDGVVSGGLNTFQYAAYLIATSLYAAGFAEYVGALAGGLPQWAGKAVAIAVVAAFALVNMVGSRLVGRAETIIVGVEAAILLGFVVLGLFKADPSLATSSLGARGVAGVVTGAALLYVTYQGFGVVTNAAGEMRQPRKQLPRAMYLALAVVATLYLLISSLVVMLLPLQQIIADSGHALADAGEAVAGRMGFVVIAGAAILATASAVNATLFAATNVGYSVAQNRQLPRPLTRTMWRRAPVALFVSALLVIVLVVFFPLDAVGQMTSMAFLVVYGAVSAGHLRLRRITGARAWPLVVGIVLNAGLFVALLADAIAQGALATWVTLLALLAASFVGEAAFRRQVSRPVRRSG